MASSQRFTVDGYDFIFTAGSGMFDFDGITIPANTGIEAVEEPKFRESLKLAILLWQDYYDYSFDSNNNAGYSPQFRQLPDWAIEPRNEFVAILKEQSDVRVATNRELFSQVKELSQSNGFVYLIKAIGTNGYKIGKSVTPKRRINHISNASPFAIATIAIIRTNNMDALEESLHEKYTDKRVSGEWFMLSDEDVQEICNMKGDE